MHCGSPRLSNSSWCLVVSTLSPDIVIIDKKKKEVNIFELTVPAEPRIKISHSLKYQKYQHLISDIGSHKVNIIPFEVGSQTGYISQENKDHIKTLHKFCQSNIKLKTFKQNISALTVLSSYLIFNSRNHGHGANTTPLPKPVNIYFVYSIFILTRNQSEQSCRNICDLSHKPS